MIRPNFSGYYHVVKSDSSEEPGGTIFFSSPSASKKSSFNINQIRENITRINSFARLNDNWNMNGAEPIQQDVINRALDLIKKLEFQPEIFPTARQSIQFEYENDSQYLEFEIFGDKIDVLIEDNGNTREFSTTSIDEIKELTQNYLGSNTLEFETYIW